MVAKLSSSSTRLAASRATSVPLLPIATPMSARASAGASFTPSPVIATNLAARLKGARRCGSSARGRPARRHGCRRSLSARSRIGQPSQLPAGHDLLVGDPACRARVAMARAVAGWSPVIITGVMPGRTAGRDRLLRLRAWRIDQPDQPEEGQIAARSSRNPRLHGSTVQRRPATASTRSPSRPLPRQARQQCGRGRLRSRIVECSEE